MLWNTQAFRENHWWTSGNTLGNFTANAEYILNADPRSRLSLGRTAQSRSIPVDELIIGIILEKTTTSLLANYYISHRHTPRRVSGTDDCAKRVLRTGRRLFHFNRDRRARPRRPTQLAKINKPEFPFYFPLCETPPSVRPEVKAPRWLLVRSRCVHRSSARIFFPMGIILFTSLFFFFALTRANECEIRWPSEAPARRRSPSIRSVKEKCKN